MEERLLNISIQLDGRRPNDQTAVRAIPHSFAFVRWKGGEIEARLSMYGRFALTLDTMHPNRAYGENEIFHNTQQLR